MHQELVSLSQVLGRSTRWQGGDVLRFPGGGQKVNLLREAINKLDKQLSGSQLISLLTGWLIMLILCSGMI